MILAIYTAHGVEVAVEEGERFASAAATGGALESMVGLIEEALGKLRGSLRDVSAVAVCTGPGSFTGLRIGVAFAKSFAQARRLPIVGVSSYDVAGFGIASYPQICLARGKTNSYYARVMETAESAPIFIQGDRTAIETAARRFVPHACVLGPDFTQRKSGDSALAVVRLARQAFERNPRHDWTDVAIDYGQRPNAVVNWERRQARAAGGPEVLPREPSS
jgi:tRNA threonylcarbamoyl adenosine modification protein YeaZ